MSEKEQLSREIHDVAPGLDPDRLPINLSEAEAPITTTGSQGGDVADLPCSDCGQDGSTWMGVEEALLDRSPRGERRYRVPAAPEGTDPLLLQHTTKLVADLRSQARERALAVLEELFLHDLAREVLEQKRHELQQTDQWLAAVASATRQLEAKVSKAEAELAEEVEAAHRAKTAKESAHAQLDVSIAAQRVRDAKGPLSRQHGPPVDEARARVGILKAEIAALEALARERVDLGALRGLCEEG
jgi:hypothetical protein